MKADDLKTLLQRALDSEENKAGIVNKLEEAGVVYSFSDGFTGRVIDKIFARPAVAGSDTEYLHIFSNAFYRIAITGIAAIILLMISIYISQGSFSVDSILGLNNGADESIICILTGN